MNHVILVMNSSMQAQVFGNHEGKPFTSERAVKAAAKKLGTAYRTVDILEMPMQPFPVDDVENP